MPLRERFAKSIATSGTEPFELMSFLSDISPTLSTRSDEFVNSLSGVEWEGI